MAVTLLSASHRAFAADAPRWLVEAAKQPPAAIDRDADAVIIHDEEHVTVQRDGRTTKRRLYAVRVQTRGGARAATMREVYRTGSGEVRSLKSWVISDGRVLELGRSDTVDGALVDNDVYNEVRVRVMSAVDRASPGAVFGGESETVESTVFAQIEWWLRSRWPAHEMRRKLTLPPGWNVRAVALNRPPLEPVVEGNTRTWTTREIAAVLEEPAGPPDSSLIPRLAVTYYGSPRSEAAFDTWDSVGRWLAALQDPKSRPTPALAAKAKELTATAATDLDRIRAIGAYTQKVQYISIQTGLGRGGGYTPHAAEDVLQKNYGDCKDKANLMRALLATLNIPSYLVGIYAGDPAYVREEWPSPQQFNHAIIAIPVARGSGLPAVSEDGSGGMLFFDPTDRYTPVGELPLTLQDSLGLVVSPAGSRLRRMPSTAADAHARDRRVTGTITPDGVFSASIQTVSTGQLASRERSRYASAPGDGYVRRLEADVRSRVSGAALTLGQVADAPERNRFEIAARLQARVFGAAPQSALIFVPAVVPLGDALPALRPGARQTPVVLDPHNEQDRLEITLPAGLVVDELPPPREMEAPFGRFEMRWTVEGSRLVRVLSLRVTRSVIPPAEYAQVRAFVDGFRDAERQPVVLARRR
jgi:hypothetical protein